MRNSITKDIIHSFFKEFSRDFKNNCSVYITGGVTAVMYGWRESTHDIDLKIIPDSEAFKVIQQIKDKLSVNIELASPDDFIPPLPGWENRSKFIERYGKVSFYHYDFYSQALSKIERGFERDLIDVEALFREKLILSEKLKELFESVEDNLIKYPAIDPSSLKRSIENLIEKHSHAT
jgi:hypothetical protein